MVLVQQTVWGWPIILYLFLGGLGGGGLLALAYTTTHLKRSNKFALVSGLIYIIAIIVGTLFLIYDLLQPTKFYLVFTNPTSWIFWGSIFLLLVTIFGILYIAPFSKDFPSLYSALSKLKLGGLIDLLDRGNKALAYTTMVLGFLTAIYTGFLISAPPTIAFWHNSAIPILFLLSGVSTGLAIGFLLSPKYGEREILLFYEKLDITAIVAELIVISALFNVALNGPRAARFSASLLINNAGFIVGVILIGLIIPLVLEIISYKKHIKEESESVNPVALLIVIGILILIGGLLLRYYILWAGAYEYPWP